MFSLIATFCVVFSATSAYPWAVDDAVLLEPTSVERLVTGPSESATIIGPDGSRIDSQVDTGAIRSSSWNEGVVARSGIPIHYTRTVPILKTSSIIAEELPVVKSIERLVEEPLDGTTIIGSDGSRIDSYVDTGSIRSSSWNGGVITRSVLPIQYTRTVPILKSSAIIAEELPVVESRSIGSLVKGSSEGATIIGPDGSRIDSHVDTGSVRSSSWNEGAWNEGVIARSVLPIQYTRTLPILKSSSVIAEELPVVSRESRNIIKGASSSQTDNEAVISSSLNEGVIHKYVARAAPVVEEARDIIKHVGGSSGSSTIVGPHSRRIDTHASSEPITSPIVQYSTNIPTVRNTLPIVHRGVSAVSYSAPLVSHSSGTLIQGPSGTIATSRSNEGLIADAYSFDC